MEPNIKELEHMILNNMHDVPDEIICNAKHDTCIVVIDDSDFEEIQKELSL